MLETTYQYYNGDAYMMRFELLDNQKLRVVLTAADLRRYRLTYEDIDYQNADTRSALLHVLQLAHTETGYLPASGKLFVEIYPLGSGCVIYFGDADSDGVELKTPEDALRAVAEPEVFTFACCDDMIAACAQVFQLYCHRIHKSSLYYFGGRFHLVLYPLDGSNGSCCAFLCEYARRAQHNSMLAAYLGEHGLPVSMGNAVDTIAYYLG